MIFLDVSTPRYISLELSMFLNIPSDAKISIKISMNDIFNYINDNNLKYKDNPKYIHVDAKLSKLLKSHSRHEPLSWFNIITRMSHNYEKLKHK